MTTWIRFRYDSGNTTLVNADESYFVFSVEEPQIEVFTMATPPEKEGDPIPIAIFPCEFSDQVAAGEELIFEAVTKSQPLTITLDLLDEQAEYLNHITGMRMVLQLLHQGSIRIPMDEVDEGDPFIFDEVENRSEISRFEEMLFTYLDVPADALQRSFKKQEGDVPFSVSRDHEECQDHGFHEYWLVTTGRDRHYTFRKKYDELAKSVMDKEGLNWQDSLEA